LAFTALLLGKPVQCNSACQTSTITLCQCLLGFCPHRCAEACQDCGQCHDPGPDGTCTKPYCKHCRNYGHSSSTCPRAQCSTCGCYGHKPAACQTVQDHCPYPIISSSHASTITSSCNSPCDFEDVSTDSPAAHATILQQDEQDQELMVGFMQLTLEHAATCSQNSTAPQHTAAPQDTTEPKHRPGDTSSTHSSMSRATSSTGAISRAHSLPSLTPGSVLWADSIKKLLGLQDNSNSDPSTSWLVKSPRITGAHFPAAVP
jgi:hypothetical protein